MSKIQIFDQLEEFYNFEVPEYVIKVQQGRQLRTQSGPIVCLPELHISGRKSLSLSMYTACGMQADCLYFSGYFLISPIMSSFPCR